MGRTTLRKRLFGLASVTVVAGSLSAVGLVAASSGPAAADTSPFEAYCPATTIGDIALTGTVVTGTLSPDPVNSGATATISPTIDVTLPEGLVAAAEGLGNTQIAGYISGQLDVTGATPATIAVGGPSTAPTSVYSGVGSFTVALPTPAAPVSISVPLGAQTVTAANSGTISVDVHKSLSVFDLVNPGPPATYLPLTCSPVNLTSVGSNVYTGATAGAGIALGSSGPINVPSPGTTASLPAGTAIQVVDTSGNAVLATIDPLSENTGATSLNVETGAGGAWTAKAAVGGTNTLYELTPTDEVISTDPITPVPVASASPTSVSFLTSTASVPISVSGANWGLNQSATTCTLKWSTGTDTGTCTTDASGNLTGTIDASVAGEQGSNVTPFTDQIVVTALNQAGVATQFFVNISISPFVSLDSFCTPTAGQLVATNPGGLQAPGVVKVAGVTLTAGSTSATVASGGFPGVLTGATVTVGGAPTSTTDLAFGTTVAAVSGNTLTLSQPATATPSGSVTLDFSGPSPVNPLTITQGAGADGYTGATGQLPAPGSGYPSGATPTVGCDPRQQINAFVLGTSLYIWESQTGANPDATHVDLSPVELGLDNTFSKDGGNLPPCAPPFPGNPACTPAVNNGQFDQALGQLNQVTVQDDRGTLTGWTVTGQMESDFTNIAAHGPAADNVIPADFLTWDPSVTLATPGSLPANNANTAGCPDQTPVPTNSGLLPCTGPSGLPQPVGGGAGVNGTSTGTGGTSSQPAEVNAGVPAPLNNLAGNADVLCATDLSLAGGSAGGGGSFDCNAGLLLAIPPYVASGQYQATIDLIVLGF